MNTDRWNSWRFTGRPSALYWKWRDSARSPYVCTIRAVRRNDRQVTPEDMRQRGQTEREEPGAARDRCLFCWCPSERLSVCHIAAGSDSAVCSLANCHWEAVITTWASLCYRSCFNYVITMHCVMIYCSNTVA